MIIEIDVTLTNYTLLISFFRLQNGSVWDKLVIVAIGCGHCCL